VSQPPRTAQGSVQKAHITGRAAVLAIVLCAIALSLAYPVREYISQRRQIDQLLAQSARIEARGRRLEGENKQLHTPAYIEQQARDRLHMCLPTQVCYEIIGGQDKKKEARVKAAAQPWYQKVWSSVRKANAVTAVPRHGRTHETARAHSG
jgi:cell division protein FtsB